MKEKGFLSGWLLGCLAFYLSLESRALAAVLPFSFLQKLFFFLLGASLLFLFFPKKEVTFFRHPLLIFPIPLVLLSIFFLKKFPLGSFSSLILQDDFTSLYAASLRTLRILREGALFGWDNRLLGGYYTVSDINFNLGFFLWPLYALLSPPLAYHLFIFFLFLAFPFLVTVLSRTLGGEKEVSGLAFWLSSFFAVSFFRNMLLWGNIDNLLGLDLFLLSVILLQKARTAPRVFFWLSAILAALAYAHLAYFLYALCLVGGFAFFSGARKRLVLFGLVAFVVFSALLPYAVHFLRHPDFYNLDARQYQPAPVGLQGDSVKSLQKFSSLAKGNAWFTAGYEGIHGGNYGACAVLFIPFLLWTFWVQRRSRFTVALIVLILFLLPLKTAAGLALKRTYFLLPVLLSLALAHGLHHFLKKGILSVLLLVPALLLGTVGLPSHEPIYHQPELRSFFRDFYVPLQGLGGHSILLETDALWIETDRREKGEPFPGPHVHLEMLLALETGKRYLSHGKDGYPFSIYRKNCLMSGIWAGRWLAESPPGEVRAFLKKWGVRSIVVWSQRARDFFDAHPDTYEKGVSDLPWTLYDFKEADPRGVVVPVGKGEIISERYTEIVVHLTGVRAGDEAVVRMNYFPDFRGYSDGKPLPLYAEDGQIAFKLPREGEVTVTLRYPRYTSLSLLGLFGFLAGSAALWKKRR